MAQGDSWRVLIVDDDRTTTGLLKTLLELDGFAVRVVPDAAACLGEVTSFGPDIFLIDYHLQDRDGADLIQSLRADNRYQLTPMVMISGADREEEAYQAGADRFMAKPFDPSELTVILNDLLGG